MLGLHWIVLACLSVELFNHSLLNDLLQVCLSHRSENEWRKHVLLIYLRHCVAENVSAVESTAMQLVVDQDDGEALPAHETLCDAQLRHDLLLSLVLQDAARIVKHEIEEQVNVGAVVLNEVSQLH